MMNGLVQLGAENALTPVLISVPHAGRHYPAAIERLSRLSLEQLQSLEDRHVDMLCQASISAGHSVMMSHFARAWIDLNRSESDVDPGMILEWQGARTGHQLSSKVRGGLGLIPRRIAKGGDIWRKQLTRADVDSRIAHVHRPYHLAVQAALDARLERFGCAILLDLHSMPPIRPSLDGKTSHLVIGDLFRRACDSRFVERICEVAAVTGFNVAINAPYAGGYALERHSSPQKGRHAVQLEIDRSLYLDADLDKPGLGLNTMSRLVLRIADALADEALTSGLALAAE